MGGYRVLLHRVQVIYLTTIDLVFASSRGVKINGIRPTSNHKLET